MYKLNNCFENELIAKLPPFRDESTYHVDFENLPLMNPLDRRRSVAERAMLVSGLNDFRIPQEFGFRVDFLIAEALRKGYRLSVRNDEQDASNRNFYFYRKKEGDTTAFVLTGPSGIGKTTAVNASLEYYDQVITHKGKDYKMQQIVYIKVECPPGGSVKSFYDACIDQMEKALGYELPDKYRAKTTDAKERLFKNCAARWNLGLLIIDEIQNIMVTKDKQVLMNQFLTLANDLCVPIVYIGTDKVRSFFRDSEFFTKRRLGTEINVAGYKKDILWDNLLAQVWEYQWMQEYVPLTEELNEIFYMETGGIINRVISLFEHAQREAILTGKDTRDAFTPEFILYISKQFFSMSRDSLNDLALSGASVLSVRESDLRQTAMAVNGFSNVADKLDGTEAFSESSVSEKEKMNLLKKSILTNVVNIISYMPQVFGKEEINYAVKQIFKNSSVLREGEENITKKVISFLLTKQPDVVGAASVDGEVTLNAGSFPRFQGVI